MYAIDSNNVYSALARRAFVLANAVLLASASVACGYSFGDPAPLEYRLICKEQKACVGESAFEEQYDSVDDCAGEIESNVDDTSGSCQEATEAALGCQLNNFYCSEGETTHLGRCEAELTAKAEACGEVEEDPAIASPDDLEDFCSLTKDCLGESDFQATFGSMDQCVTYYQDILDGADQTCRELVSAAILCDVDNFECTDGEPTIADTCQDEYDELNAQCSS